jgi:hypothetical protein
VAVEQARMAWIRDQVNPDAPEETHIVIGIDCSVQATIGDRVVSQLLNSGMEGEEGVFYLLPQDVCYTATRSAGFVTIDLVTTLARLNSKGTLVGTDRERAEAAGLIPRDALARVAVGAEWDEGAESDEDAAIEWVTVLSATIPFPEDAALPGPPIVLIDHEGVAGLDELVASIPEAGVCIVGSKPEA